MLCKNLFSSELPSLVVWLGARGDRTARAPIKVILARDRLIHPGLLVALHGQHCETPEVVGLLTLEGVCFEGALTCDLPGRGRGACTHPHRTAGPS